MAKAPLLTGPMSTEIHVRITPDLKAAAEALAREDRRTLSDYVRQLIERATLEPKLP